MASGEDSQPEKSESAEADTEATEQTPINEAAFTTAESASVTDPSASGSSVINTQSNQEHPQPKPAVPKPRYSQKPCVLPVIRQPLSWVYF